MYWQEAVDPAEWCLRGLWWRGWLSFGGRSLFFAKMTEPSAVIDPRTTEVSQESAWSISVPPERALQRECLKVYRARSRPIQRQRRERPGGFRQARRYLCVDLRYQTPVMASVCYFQRPRLVRCARRKR